MLVRGDARCLPLAAESVDCVVTSPPYWGLRRYPDARQIGLEPTPAAYVAQLVTVFQQVWRVLKPHGTVWLNLGDTYCGYWGDAQALAENRPSRADTNGWTNGFAMNARPKYDTLRATGLKPKDLVGIPWAVAFALREAGWYLRSDIIFSKPNPMPESVTDRPTTAHEHLFLLAKQERYYFDAAAIAEPVSQYQPPRRFGRKEYAQAQRDHGHQGARAVAVANGQGTETSMGNHYGRVFGGETSRNKRSVWTVNVEKSYDGAHFAVMPEALVEPCILAGCPVGGVVLDPFIGSGTVGAVAERLGRRWVGVDLAYQTVAAARTAQMGLSW